MKRISKLTTAFCIAALCVVGTVVWILDNESYRVVKTTRVARDAMSSRIRVTGEVINDRTVTLTALVDGQISALSVQKGNRVKKGDLLAQLDDEQARAQMLRSRALVAREQAAVHETQQRYRRLKNVSTDGGASVQDIDAAEAAWMTARADLKVAESDLVLAKIHIKKFQLTAPFDGVVVEKTAEVGQWLEAGTTLLKVVAQTGREIEAHVDAADSGAVKLGQAVTLSCDAYPGKEWRSTIHWIGPAVSRDDQKNLNTFAVRVDPGENSPPLLIGQQVDVNILTAERTQALQVPFNALHEIENTMRVAMIDNHRIRYQTITTGIENFTHVEVLEGLQANDEVVLFEEATLPEGTLVKRKDTPTDD